MKKKIGISLAVFLVFSSLFALDVPQLSACVNDYAGLLKDVEKEELENYLRNVNETTKVQITLLTIKSLEEDSIEDYSIRVAEQWKLGDAKENSGAILIVSKEDRKIRIEVGYGLEKDLTDAVCSSIINKTIASSFKRGDYYKGISEGLHAMVGYALKDENLIKPNSNEKRIEENEEDFSFKWSRSTWILLAILYIFMGRKMGNFFWPFFFFSNFFGYDRKYGRRRKSSNWTPFDPTSSSGTFGGSIFGGFSSDDNNNFSGNGGSFGGGGASGGW